MTCESPYPVQIYVTTSSFLFNIVLGFCVVIRERYQAMDLDSLLAYRSMHRLLLMVRDIDFSPAVFDLLLAQQQPE